MSTGQIFFVVGIVGMLATATLLTMALAASVISARILSKQEKKMKKEIWNEYK